MSSLTREKLFLNIVLLFFFKYDVGLYAFLVLADVWKSFCLEYVLFTFGLRGLALKLIYIIELPAERHPGSFQGRLVASAMRPQIEND